MYRTSWTIECSFKKHELVSYNKAIKIPSLAHSIVPAVVGLTNLFCIICCIIKPAKANELPAIKNTHCPWYSA